MKEFLMYLVFGSFWIFGIFKIFDDILIHTKVWVEYKIGRWSKVLVSCPPCMASFHGIYLGLFFVGPHPSVIMYCVCLCGLNYIINSMLKYD